MDTICERIERLRKAYGVDVAILGHHYQRSRVIRHADVRGDSLDLSRHAAAGTASRIVFCGVRFMAESADILSGADRTVYLPAPHAGCPMADMADVNSLEAAWRVVTSLSGDWLPIVYVNSSAEVKAFCGRHGGSACTSSNAARVFRWALEQGKRILFVPDEHLGWNTAGLVGIADADVAVYDPSRPGGGLAAGALETARLVVWRGYCIVHRAFTVPQVERIRADLPRARIIVHPETPREVARLCDAMGSTSQIIDYVNRAAPGETIVVGTELNLIQRLAEDNAGRLTVKALAPSVCANMAKITEESLLETLEEWPERCIVRVPDAVAAGARLCLARMLELSKP